MSRKDDLRLTSGFGTNKRAWDRFLFERGLGANINKRVKKRHKKPSRDRDVKAGSNNTAQSGQPDSVRRQKHSEALEGDNGQGRTGAIQ